MASQGRIPAVVLAGGRATRMGGADKALMPLGGRTLLDHVIDRLAPQAAPLAINANGDPIRFVRFGLPVLSDTLAGFRGPLAGILAGMDWAETLGVGQIVSVAADTPFFPQDLVARLQAVVAPSGLVLAALRGADGAVRLQPTFGLWPVSLRAALRRDLIAGHAKVQQWATAHGAAIAVFDEQPMAGFFNVNTPEDLLLADQMVAAGPPDFDV